MLFRSVLHQQRRGPPRTAALQPLKPLKPLQRRERRSSRSHARPTSNVQRQQQRPLERLPTIAPRQRALRPRVPHRVHPGQPHKLGGRVAVQRADAWAGTDAVGSARRTVFVMDAVACVRVRSFIRVVGSLLALPAIQSVSRMELLLLASHPWTCILLSIRIGTQPHFDQ